jgi:hypothetical protein
MQLSLGLLKNKQVEAGQNTPVNQSIERQSIWRDDFCCSYGSSYNGVPGARLRVAYLNQVHLLHDQNPDRIFEILAC